MTKKLPKKSPRKTMKPKFEVTPAMQIRFEKAMASVGRTADKDARKDDKIQREARLAIAETLEIWIEWMLDENPDQVEDIFFELGAFATTTNRRRLLKHAQAPEGAADRIEKQVAVWKEADEAEKAAAAAKAAADQVEKGSSTPRGAEDDSAN